MRFVNNIKQKLRKDAATESTSFETPNAEVLWIKEAQRCLTESGGFKTLEKQFNLFKTVMEFGDVVAASPMLMYHTM